MRGLINTKYSDWIIAAVFALTIFVQCVLFHYIIYHEILLSSLWHSPLHFFRFYLPHLTIALFCASFVFLFKQKWWTLTISLFFNVWIWANLWYYRANNVFIDNYAVGMIGNLNGLWNSIFALIRPVDFIFLSLPIILSITMYLFKESAAKKTTKTFVVILGVSIVLGLCNASILIKKTGYKKHINPINSYKDIFAHRIKEYVYDHSIIHYAAYTIRDLITEDNNENYVLTKAEENRIEKFINGSVKNEHPKTQMILCVIESFNSFAITKEIMPNLNNFIDTSENILYVSKITSQTKTGNSGDGQMIILTGMLPIANGAACMRFSDDKYYSLAALYKKTLGIFPHSLEMWNQTHMSKSYKIDKNISLLDANKDIINAHIDDASVFSTATNYAKDHDFVMALTLDMHIPCNSVSSRSKLELPDTIPSLLRKYIKSTNVTDEAIKTLIDAIRVDNKLKNATIVFTGDHCLPVPSDEDFGGNYGYSRFIPLIIYSPEIKQKTIITDTCYQMDIYPTILHLIGCEDYHWKGFGVNLLDSAARLNRPITPEEAYDLSDKMIRADYFKKYAKE